MARGCRKSALIADENLLLDQVLPWDAQGGFNGRQGEGMPQDRALSFRFGRLEFGRVALGAAIAAALVCSHVSVARAGDDGDDSQSVTDKILSTIGLKNPAATELGINYSERSPLVVPPTRDLVPPAAGGPPANPNWPKDPDVKRRKTKKDDKPRYQRDYVIESSRPLRPDELNVPGGGPQSTGSTNTTTATTTTAADTAPKKSLFSGMFQKEEEYSTFTGEPARASLTDPPRGYMTPSPDQPYGIAPDRKTYKIPTVADRMEPVR
jgi:hypothetical protein